MNAPAHRWRLGFTGERGDGDTVPVAICERCGAMKRAAAAPNYRTVYLYRGAGQVEWQLHMPVCVSAEEKVEER